MSDAQIYLRGYRPASKTWDGWLQWLPVSLPTEDDIRYIRADIHDRDIALQIEGLKQLRSDNALLRADAERYRVLRQRVEMRAVETADGSARLGLGIRLGCAFPEMPIPLRVYPDGKSDHRPGELDAALDALREENP